MTYDVADAIIGDDDFEFEITQQFVDDFSMMIHESCVGLADDDDGLSYDAWLNFYCMDNGEYRRSTTVRELTRAMDNERGVALWLFEYFDAN